MRVAYLGHDRGPYARCSAAVKCAEPEKQRGVWDLKHQEEGGERGSDTERQRPSPGEPVG